MRDEGPLKRSYDHATNPLDGIGTQAHALGGGRRSSRSAFCRKLGFQPDSADSASSLSNPLPIRDSKIEISACHFPVFFQIAINSGDP